MTKDQGAAEFEVNASGPIAAETEAEEAASRRRPKADVIEVLGPGRCSSQAVRRAT